MSEIRGFTIALESTERHPGGHRKPKGEGRCGGGCNKPIGHG